MEGEVNLSIFSRQAGLQPRDPVEVVYEVRGVEGGGGEVVASLQCIISEHLEYIEGTTKGPVCPRTPDCDLTHMIVEEEQKVCRCVCWEGGEEERECVQVCVLEGRMCDHVCLCGV